MSEALASIFHRSVFVATRARAFASTSKCGMDSAIYAETTFKMAKTTEVFRRFGTFTEALQFAQGVRNDCEFIRVMYSPEREPRDNDMPPLGPWLATTDDDMVRTWETVCATFRAGHRGHIARTVADRIERRLAHGKFLPGDPDDTDATELARNLDQRDAQ